MTHDTPYRPEDLINLVDFPIHQNGPGRDALIREVHAQLAADGCAVLKRFLTERAVTLLTEEADSVASCAHQSFNRTNPYFTADDPLLDAADPRRRFYDRSNALIPADNFIPTGPLRVIQDFSAFDPFIQTCLQQKNFYRYADPLADVIVNMAEEGEGFPWHFDTNNFTITPAIQSVEEGGLFQYAPIYGLRVRTFRQYARCLTALLIWCAHWSWSQVICKFSRGVTLCIGSLHCGAQRRVM